MDLSSLILHETGDWIALNKPSGLLSIPDREGKEPSLKSMLKEKYPGILTVHRIDRETSGLILFAKTETGHKKLNTLFELRETEKIYNGLVVGRLSTKSGSIQSPIAEHPARNGTMIIHRNGKPAHTDYEVVEEFNSFSWMRFRIHTGRTHQIRVHMKDLGHPIAVDPVYGDGKPIFLSQVKRNFKLSKKEEEETPILKRLGLHAAALKFIYNQESFSLEAPVPKDLSATLKQLRKNSR